MLDRNILLPFVTHPKSSRERYPQQPTKGPSQYHPITHRHQNHVQPLQTTTLYSSSPEMDIPPQTSSFQPRERALHPAARPIDLGCFILRYLYKSHVLSQIISTIRCYQTTSSRLDIPRPSSSPRKTDSQQKRILSLKPE
jgi:hypothetical protein